MSPSIHVAHDDPDVEIREVWSENLESEFAVIRDLIDDFPFVAMDTEFPGIAIRSVDVSSLTLSEFNYKNLRLNVNLLHLIQLGLVLSDAAGNLPAPPSTSAGRPRPCIWQFNFREFDPASDIFQSGSMDLLKTSGIDVTKNRASGVSAMHFAELLMSSGVVLNDSVVWITFHGGYDFGYLLKTLICCDLPDTVDVFFKILRVFFPNLYDVKHLMRFCHSNFHGGLNELAKTLRVERVGICHQAGSDSLLTLQCFTALRERYLNNNVERYAGVLFGLGNEYSQSIK